MFAGKGKSQVLGLGKVAITKDRHMDKVMLVESLGYNLMSVSMLCVDHPADELVHLMNSYTSSVTNMTSNSSDEFHQRVKTDIAV